MGNRSRCVAYCNGRRTGTGEVGQASFSERTFESLLYRPDRIAQSRDFSGSEVLNLPLIGQADG